MIEVTIKDNGGKALVNINHILSVFGNVIEFTETNYIRVDETYEEIKQLIKEANGK